MPNLQPIAPNFYSKSVTASSNPGITAVQNSGGIRNGNQISARGTQNKALPGTIPGRQIRPTTPDVFLQGVINTAVGVTQAVLDSAIPPVRYGVDNLTAAATDYYIDPSTARLAAAGYPVTNFGTGPGTDGSLPFNTFSPPAVFTDATEDRVLS